MPIVHREMKHRKRLKQSTYYRKRRLRENHVKMFKIHKPPIKYKRFIYGEIGHYARNCIRDRVNKEKLNMYQQLELPEEIDIINVASNDTAKDSDI